MAAGKAKTKKGKHAHHLAGTISALERDNISIRTKQQGTKQFCLTAATLVKFKGKKGVAAKPASAAALEIGEHVKVVAAGDNARQIDIKTKLHKRKKA